MFMNHLKEGRGKGRGRLGERVPLIKRMAERLPAVCTGIPHLYLTSYCNGIICWTLFLLLHFQKWSFATILQVRKPRQRVVK